MRGGRSEGEKKRQGLFLQVVTALEAGKFLTIVSMLQSMRVNRDKLCVTGLVIVRQKAENFQRFGPYVRGRAVVSFGGHGC